MEQEDAQWAEDTIKRASEELRQTAPNGRQFAETIQVLLEREKNWIKWKNELCNTFDREAWTKEVDGVDEEGRKVKRKIGLEEATYDTRKELWKAKPPFEHRYGSGPLTEIWDMGYRDIYDLQRPFQYVFSIRSLSVLSDDSLHRMPSLDDFVKKIKQEDARIEMRKKQIFKQAERLLQAQSRAKAAAAAAAAQKEAEEAAAATAPESPAPSTTSATAETASATSAPRSLPAPSTPLQHPLPAKPGSAPNKPPSQDNTTSASTPTSTPAPAPAPAPQPSPEPVPEPNYAVDAMIQQYEEVSSGFPPFPNFCSHEHPFAIRVNSAGRGSLCEPRGMCISII